GITFADGVISGTATADTAAASVTVTATDAGGLTASEAFTIRAVSAPVINAIEVKQDTSDIAKAGEELTITATLSESFALTLNDATPTMLVTLGATDVTATYASHDADSKTITFVATAPAGDVTSVVVKSVTLGAATLIGAVSNQPLATASVGQTDANFTLDNTAAAVTTETLSAAENSTVVGSIATSEEATVVLGTGDDSALFTLTDGVLTLNAAQDFETDDTSLTVNFDLTDTAGNTSTDSLTVNVTNVNEAPVGVDIAAQTAVVDQAFSLDVTGSFSDVDANDTITYSIVGDLPAGITFADGVISGTATADTAAASVTVTATDAGGLTASEAFTISAVSAPIITTELSNLGEKMLDVRSDIILQIDQAVSAVTGKTITFTDNTETGYQGETKTNSFTIAADSDLVTIDNDKGVIIINVDANFDLDLSSNYTLSIDDGAFVSTASGLSTATFADISFNTITPTSGEVSLTGLGSVDEDASIANYLPDFLASDAGILYAAFPESIQLSAAQLEWAELSGEAKTDYIVSKTAAQGYMMNDDDGSLVASAQWVDLEGLGIGSKSGVVNLLGDDIASGNVFALDASTNNYVFVFSDQKPNGGNETKGAGIETNTDLAVFIDEFGSDDVIYVDDAFNDADNINILAYEVFASGNGGDGSELFLGLNGGDGDPRLYVNLEGDIESTDEN
ncbi:MAG: putative Ig domain-containing protein, partial [Glaciecola sp.]|nr:putative Ig domain-containing protein [Glaciecola sp.]